jgi:hypothetical protein
MSDFKTEAIEPSKTGEVRRCIQCAWETNYIIKKENGECPRCHGCVKYIIMDAKENKTLTTRETLLARLKERYEFHLRCVKGGDDNWSRIAALELKRVIEEAEGTYDHATGAKLD